MCVCKCVCFCECVHVCVCQCMCFCMSVCEYVCVHLCVCMYASVHVCTSVFVYVSMYVYLCVHVCVWGGGGACDVSTHPTGWTAEYMSRNDVVLYCDVSNTICKPHQHNPVIRSPEVKTQVFTVFWRTDSARNQSKVEAESMWLKNK